MEIFDSVSQLVPENTRNSSQYQELHDLVKKIWASATDMGEEVLIQIELFEELEKLVLNHLKSAN